MLRTPGEPAGSRLVFVLHAADLPAQDRILVPKRQQVGIPDLIPAKRQDYEAQ
jgi:hypothetical protein